LAYCNKSSDTTNFSFNTSIVSDSSGGVSADYIKLKFNFISSNITKSGNTIRFYKWRIVGSQSVLDQTPLSVATYDFSSGQTNSALTTSLAADQVNGTYGYYIQLNDPSQVYQVIKVVAYDSSGTVIASLNSLIPAFYANPAEYAYNSDGTARAMILQQLQPLYGTTTGYTAAQFQSYFNQYCF